jgi:hypothetical protein
LAKVEGTGPTRPLVVKGRLYVVRCAIRADGSCPAGDFLAALKAGTLAGDTDDADAGLQPDERFSDYGWFIKTIMHFADEGEPPYTRAINYLEAGIWEFKHGSKRITFYDTSGGGRYWEKDEIVDHADAHEPDSEHWHIPNFDREIRLGHCFLKDGNNTRGSDLTTMREVREEDLDHDKPTT